MVSNSGCSCARVMNFFLFPRFFRSKKSFQLLPYAWPSRVTLKLKVTLWSTWLFFISACMYPTAMIFMLFRDVFRSRNSLQLSQFAWPLRVTLKLKVTLRSTWLLLFLLVFVRSRWLFFCFVRFLVQEIHSNYCQLRDLHAWPWKPKVTSLSTWLFDLSGC